jgi:hypothetical protein
MNMTDWHRRAWQRDIHPLAFQRGGAISRLNRLASRL